MRRVPTSGGLELGVLETGPWLDIMPMRPGFRPELSDVERAVLVPIRWDAWQPASMTTPGAGVERIKRTMRGVTAFASDANLSIRLLWSKDQDPASALYAIEEVEQGLPYAVVGALLTAATAKRLPTASAHAIALACAFTAGASHPDTVSGPSERLRRTQIDELVNAMFFLVPGKLPDMTAPPGAVNRARFWLAVARKLWEFTRPDTLHRSYLAHVQAADDLPRLLASTWLDIQDLPRVHIAGVELDVPEQARTRAWPQCMAWAHDNIPADALRFLVGSRIPDGPPTVDRTTDSTPQPVVPDADLCHGLATTLLREAHDKAAYVPTGQFSLHLPQDYPLKAWGVAGLRVVALSGALWCTVVTDQRQPGVTLHWQPGRPLRTWTVAAEVAPLLNVTLAALWRDLCIAGDVAVPPAVGRQVSATAQQTPAPSRPPTRTLPGRQRFTVSGKRTWGSTADHEAIHLRAHGVRGHLRRLHTGWSPSDDARQIATEYGLPIPDGYTFVRPHLRGADSDPQPDAGPATIIHARGLQAVMTLL